MDKGCPILVNSSSRLCCFYFRIAVVPTKDPVKDKRYVAYITKDKIGMNILPLDGNPHNSMALIGHPAGVIVFVVRFTELGSSTIIYVLIIALCVNEYVLFTWTDGTCTSKLLS